MGQGGQCLFPFQGSPHPHLRQLALALPRTTEGSGSGLRSSVFSVRSMGEPPTPEPPSGNKGGVPPSPPTGQRPSPQRRAGPRPDCSSQNRSTDTDRKPGCGESRPAAPAGQQAPGPGRGSQWLEQKPLCAGPRQGAGRGQASRAQTLEAGQGGPSCRGHDLQPPGHQMAGRGGPSPRR